MATQAGVPRYTLASDRQQSFAALYLLHRMINLRETYSVLLEGDDAYFKDAIDALFLKKQFIAISQDRYVPTPEGRAYLQKFMDRYIEFLRAYDLYCAVDLTRGEFAFASYYTIEDDSQWRIFLNDERWEDLRVAVAQYKGIDPIEIVFMSFMQEDRFSESDKTSCWQLNLALESPLFTEILRICNSNLAWERLGKNHKQAEDIIRDIITQGTALMLSLLKEEKKRDADREAQESAEAQVQQGTHAVQAECVEVVTYVQYPVAYYDPYAYDPFYVPGWYSPWYW